MGHRVPPSRARCPGSARGPTATATLRFRTMPGRPLTVLVRLRHQRPRRSPPVPVRIEVDGRVADRGRALGAPIADRGAGRGRGPRRGREPSPRRHRRRADPVRHVRTRRGHGQRRSPPARGPAAGRCTSDRAARPARPGGFPASRPAPLSAAWTRSYGAIVVQLRVHRASGSSATGSATAHVLYPPVTMHKAGVKEPVILSVGRFFDADPGPFEEAARARPGVPTAPRPGCSRLDPAPRRRLWRGGSPLRRAGAARRRGPARSSSTSTPRGTSSSRSTPGATSTGTPPGLGEDDAATSGSTRALRHHHRRGDVGRRRARRRRRRRPARDRAPRRRRLPLPHARRVSARRPWRSSPMTRCAMAWPARRHGARRVRSRSTPSSRVYTASSRAFWHRPDPITESTWGTDERHAERVAASGRRRHDARLWAGASDPTAPSCGVARSTSALPRWTSSSGAAARSRVWRTGFTHSPSLTTRWPIEKVHVERAFQTWVPPGHFYSPFPDPNDYEARVERLLDPLSEPAGIDLHEADQLDLLEELGAFGGDPRFPTTATARLATGSTIRRTPGATASSCTPCCDTSGHGRSSRWAPGTRRP